MATQDFTLIEDILKEWYAPAIVNQIYVKSPFWAQVKKTSKGVAGKRVYIPLRHTLSEAVGGNIAGTHTLPTANRIQYDSTQIYQKRLYGRVQVDGYSIEASKGKGGWIDVFSGETRGIAEAFGIDVDQQVMGRGTAILGHAVGDFAAGGLGTEEIGVDNPHGVAVEATPGYGWFRKGMLIDIFSSSGSAPLTGGNDLEIQAVDYSTNNSLTFESGDAAACGTVTDGDFLVRANTGSFTSGTTVADAHAAGNGVLMGIDRIVDTDVSIAAPDATNFQGIDASAAAQNWWRAQKMRTSDTILTEMKIQEDLDQIAQNTDGEAPNLAMTTYALRNKLIEICKSEKMISNMNFVAGWEGIKYKGGAVSLPILVHKYCPTKYWYYLNLKYVRFYTLKKLVWDNSGGGIIKPVTNEDQYEAWFKLYGNLGTDKRNAFGKSTNYTTS